MKRFFLLILCSSYIVNLLAQDFTSKFGIELLYQPNLSYRLVTFKSPDYKDEVGGIFKEQTPKYGYSSGILFSYMIKEQWGFRTGVCFSNKGYNHNFEISIYDIYQKHSFIYIDIPFEFKYRISRTEKHNVDLYFGLLLDISQKKITKERIEYSDSCESNIYRKNLKGLKYDNFSLQFGLGYEYLINKKLSLFIAPKIDCMLFHFGETNDDISLRFFNIGLQLGVRYNL